jgi:hypothetical protein
VVEEWRLVTALWFVGRGVGGDRFQREKEKGKRWRQGDELSSVGISRDGRNGCRGAQVNDNDAWGALQKV